MNKGIPEQQDFKFEHLGVQYAIGYDIVADALVMVAKTGDNWNWITSVMLVSETLEQPEDYKYKKDADDLLNELMINVNEYFSNLDNGDIPVDKNSLEYLVYIVKNTLKFSGGKLSIL